MSTKKQSKQRKQSDDSWETRAWSNAWSPTWEATSEKTRNKKSDKRSKS